MVIKRLFDIILSATALIVLSPLLAAVAVLVKIDSKGPAFFRQQRIGREFEPFSICKFRTMHTGLSGQPITVGADPRVTRVGRVLRRTKLDELPQLFNVLKGEMSLVGPRPEIPKYVEMFKSDFRDVLAIRPGLTDLASLRYRDESALLAGFADPEGEYVRSILPDKIRLAREYARRSSLSFDLILIARTFGSLWVRRQLVG